MKRMITRTIDLHTYTVRTLNVETAEVRDIDYTIGTHYADAKVLAELRAQHETDALKLVAIVNHTTETRMYGMDEQTFINLATVLPPRGKTENAPE